MEPRGRVPEILPEPLERVPVAVPMAEQAKLRTWLVARGFKVAALNKHKWTTDVEEQEAIYRLHGIVPQLIKGSQL